MGYVWWGNIVSALDVEEKDHFQTIKSLLDENGYSFIIVEPEGFLIGIDRNDREELSKKLVHNWTMYSYDGKIHFFFKTLVDAIMFKMIVY
jgi:hypothetical protein